MGFKDKYTNKELNEGNKTLISTETYVQCELMEELNQTIEKLRLTLWQP